MIKTIQPKALNYIGFQITPTQNIDKINYLFDLFKKRIKNKYKKIPYNVELELANIEIKYDPLIDKNNQAPCVEFLISERYLFIGDWLVFNGFNLVIYRPTDFSQLFDFL